MELSCGRKRTHFVQLAKTLTSNTDNTDKINNMDPGSGGNGGGDLGHSFLASVANKEAAAIKNKLKPGAKAHVSHDTSDFKKPFKVPAAAFKNKSLIPGMGRKKSSMKVCGSVNIDLDGETWVQHDVWFIPKVECLGKKLPEVTEYEMTDAERATPRKINHVLPDSGDLK